MQYALTLMHLFLIDIGGVPHRDTAACTDREFEMILDQYGGYLPQNIRAYHFQREHGPNEAVMRFPSIPIPIYELTRPEAGKVPEGLRLHHRRGPRAGIPVARRWMDFVWVEHESPGGLIAYLDGGEYSLLSKYTAIPVTFRYAANYINCLHRHNVAPQGHKFSVALESVEGRTVGVLIASEPKARRQNDGRTLEINRCCADPRYHNVCSALIGRAVRMGKEMGYTRFISYTLESEYGSTLKAAGFKLDGIVKGRAGGWDSPSRRRDLPERYPAGDKKRWILNFAA